jgi:uncharacterized protein GlcG (DUF336 family)/catechol 2,3-dioxygenase-like lactoylglutathione lyase family enzyme
MTSPRLSLKMAQAITSAGLAHAREIGALPLAIAVLDAGGHVIAVAREDGASLLRTEIATAKAKGALGLGMSSREIATRAAQNASFFSAIATLTSGAVVPSPGGLLLHDEGQDILGAVGVSGDRPDVDEACAEAGLRALESSRRSRTGPAGAAIALRSIELVLPNAQSAAAFLTDVWGLAHAHATASTLYLRGSGPHPYLIALTEGPAPFVRSVTFTCSTSALDAIAQGVEAQKLPATRTTSSDPGAGHGLLVEMPDGEIFRFLADTQSVAPLQGDDLPVQLTHVVFNATDAEHSADTAEQALGFRVSDRTKAMVFVRCNAAHHSIAFARAGHACLNHIAFEMKDVDAVMRGIGRLADVQAAPAWGPGRHGPGANVFAYFIAPFGAVVEFSTAVERVPDDHRVGAPEDWTWPPGRIDRWGISKKDVDALARAERTFCFRREWEPGLIREPQPQTQQQPQGKPR